MTWTLTCDGVLTISGSGGMTDFGVHNVASRSYYAKINIPIPWNDYKNIITKIIIENGVTTIGHFAFKNCNNLVKVTLPNSIKRIGQEAFYGCSNLSEANIPNSLETINYYAFEGCKQLNNLTIPSTLTNIGGHAFFDTGWIERKRQENSLVVVNGILIDGYKAQGNITVPSSALQICALAFSDCPTVSKIIIPSHIEKIGNKAFYNCSSLQAIDVDGGNKKYSSVDGALYNKKNSELICCPGGKKDLTIPDSCTSIGDSAFENNTNLKSVTIPKSVKEFGSSVFYGCKDFVIYCYKDSKTEEYAKKNNYKYTILWQLRYNGEEKYLDCQNVQGLFDTFSEIKGLFLLKKAVVMNTQERLDNIKFRMNNNIVIPTSVAYMKKAIVHCPVNVLIYHNDDLIASLINGVESDITNEYGRFAVTYNPCTGEYEKIIAQFTNEDLVIKMVAVDDGFVHYDFAYRNNADEVKFVRFDNESVNKDDIIETSTNLTYLDYSIDKKGDGVLDSTKSLHELSNNYIQVNKITSKTSKYEMKIGDTVLLEYEVLPINATYKTVDLISNDTGIVDVINGKLIAKAVGSTTILVRSNDNANVNYEVSITVSDKKSRFDYGFIICIGLIAIPVLIMVIIKKIKS